MKSCVPAEVRADRSETIRQRLAIMLSACGKQCNCICLVDVKYFEYILKVQVQVSDSVSWDCTHDNKMNASWIMHIHC